MSGFARLFRVNDIVDRVGGLLQVLLQFVEHCCARFGILILCRVLEFFDGSPRAVIFDNLKPKASLTSVNEIESTPSGFSSLKASAIPSRV